ncbi:GtrA family protein [Vandammella animalimorsus]|uniref:GtrA/DPMS transmembrane domain-containing protein n=1 Tax=Vandammella animalimorsus TaxID=2029117 RepID=A0A2A2B0P4_9BURK|nr:GtrA family protein [Vandammella animalimorsus]PAT43532.1 hypothetical protein CK621_03395 [Vandammella animalimorsus]
MKLSEISYKDTKIWSELLLATRFGTVGALATFVHLLIVWLLLKQTSTPLIIANTLAFLAAFVFSFIGNYIWTFRSPGKARRAMLRFFLIAASAFFINTLVLHALAQSGRFSALSAAMTSASLVPLISFLASKLWGFKTHEKAAMPHQCNSRTRTHNNTP